MKQVDQLIWLFFIVMFFVACEQNGGESTPAATDVNVESEEVTATETAVPTQTATIEPTATDTPMPTPTATSEPTPEPTSIPEPTPAEIELIIDEVPDEVFADEAVIISGQALPVPAENVIVRIMVAGGQEVVRENVPVTQASGSWTATLTLPPDIVGPANLTAHLESEEIGPLHRLLIQPDRSSENTYIDVKAVKPDGTAVAGYAFIFEGFVNEPVAETVTISILDNECTTNAASQSFSVPGGSWYGFTIVSANAEPGQACAVAMTGSQAEGNLREYRIPIDILSADDPEAIFLEVGLADEIAFKAGETTNLFGLAINVPGNEVVLSLESDDPSRPSAVITSGMAFADQFGFWEIDLEVPEEVTGSALLYVTSGTNDENYREIRIPVIIEE